MVPPSFEYGLVLLATLIREEDHNHKIMDRAFMPKYGTLSQVLLQLVVEHINLSSTFATGCRTYKSVKYSETAPYGLAKTAIHFVLKNNPSLIRPPH